MLKKTPDMKEELSSIRLLLTDHFGSILNSPTHQRISISYTPYGHTKKDNLSISRLGFTAQPLDASSTCYFLGNGYRLFSPKLMRFYSQDRESPFAEGGINAYCYCNNDPINKYDPTGQSGVFPPTSGFRYQGTARVIKKMRVFYSPDPENPGSTILNINTHGGAGFLWSSWRPQTANKIAKTLEKHGISLSGQRTHFISCHSACKPFWGQPLNVQMSKITNAPSTGYLGPVTTYPANSVAQTNTEFFNINVDAENPFKKNDTRYKKFRYVPITIYPDRSDQPTEQQKNIRLGQS